MNNIIATEWRSVDLLPPPTVYRWDQDDTRYYARVTGNAEAGHTVAWYPSVTTVIRDTSPMPPHLLKWYADKGLAEATAVRDEAAEYGTLFHEYAGHLITGGSIEGDHFATLPNRLQKDLAALITWAQEYNVRPLASEMLLVSESLRMAGTVDLVCEMDHVEKSGDRTRKIAVVDYKTSSGLYSSHELQVNIYRHMWNECYDNSAICEHRKHASAAILWRPKDWRKAPTWEMKDVADEDAFPEINAMAKLWHTRNADWSPKVKQRVEFGGDSESISIHSEPRLVSIDPVETIINKHIEVTR